MNIQINNRYIEIFLEAFSIIAIISIILVLGTFAAIAVVITIPFFVAGMVIDYYKQQNGEKIQ